jgi:3-oxoadipate enol-lactonase
MDKAGNSALHYEINGSGPPLVLAHSLSSNMSMWEEQRALLERHFQVIRFDVRGHGKSPVPKGPYTMRALAGDAAALLDRLGIRQVTWVGISLGGMIGQVLALERPELISRMVLADTTSGYPPAGQAAWVDRIAHVESGGMEAVVGGTLERWFTESFRDANPEIVARIRTMILATDPAGFVACGHAIRNFDVKDEIGAIACPVLVMVGEADHATPPEMSRAIAAAIPGARFELIPGAAHQSAIEQPVLFNSHLADFFGISEGGVP